MTKLERIIEEPLITSGKIKFYRRYVDYILLLAKEEDIFLSDKINSFNKNVKFKIDRFYDKNI